MSEILPLRNSLKCMFSVAGSGAPWYNLQKIPETAPRLEGGGWLRLESYILPFGTEGKCHNRFSYPGEIKA